MKGRQYPPMWQSKAPWPRQREVGDLSWQSRASCSGVADEVSEQLLEATMTGDAADEIATYCSVCPVAAECLQAGREWKADGVWGGQVLASGEVAPVRRREAS